MRGSIPWTWQLLILKLFIMANEKKGKRKVFFVQGAPGDPHVKIVSGGKFTKKVRKHKARICGQG